MVCVFQVQQLNHMDEVCYENVLKQIMAGHQVFIFALVCIQSTYKEISYDHHNDVLRIFLKIIVILRYVT